MPYKRMRAGGYRRRRWGFRRPAFKRRRYYRRRSVYRRPYRRYTRRQPYNHMMKCVLRTTKSLTINNTTGGTQDAYAYDVAETTRNASWKAITEKYAWLFDEYKPKVIYLTFSSGVNNYLSQKDQPVNRLWWAYDNDSDGRPLTTFDSIKNLPNAKWRFLPAGKAVRVKLFPRYNDIYGINTAAAGQRFDVEGGNPWRDGGTVSTAGEGVAEPSMNTIQYAIEGNQGASLRIDITVILMFRGMRNGVNYKPWPTTPPPSPIPPPEEEDWMLNVEDM